MGFRSESDDALRLTAVALEKAVAAALDPEGQRHLAAALELFRRDTITRNLQARDAMRHRSRKELQPRMG